jgi:hypothetical protein
VPEPAAPGSGEENQQCVGDDKPLSELQGDEQHRGTTTMIAANERRGNKWQGVQETPGIGHTDMKQEIISQWRRLTQNHPGKQNCAECDRAGKSPTYTRSSHATPRDAVNTNSRLPSVMMDQHHLGSRDYVA